MIRSFVTGPNTRESRLLLRLSPIMKYSFSPKSHVRRSPGTLRVNGVRTAAVRFFRPGEITAIPLAYGVFCATFDVALAAYFVRRKRSWEHAALTQA